MSWNTEIVKEERMPNYFSKAFWQRVTGSKISEYKNHLMSLGWKYASSPGGSYWQSPDGKRVWL